MLMQIPRKVQIGVRRLFFLTHRDVQLGEAPLHARIIRLDFEQPAQNFDGFGGLIGFQVRFGELQKNRPRLAQDSLLDVKIREFFERLRFVRSQFRNLFVNRDGLAVESVVEIKLRQALEIFDRLRHAVLPHEEIPNGH